MISRVTGFIFMFRCKLIPSSSHPILLILGTDMSYMAVSHPHQLEVKTYSLEGG